jgi:hypothetical protein
MIFCKIWDFWLPTYVGGLWGPDSMELQQVINIAQGYDGGCDYLCMQETTQQGSWPFLPVDLLVL